MWLAVGERSHHSGGLLSRQFRIARQSVVAATWDSGKMARRHGLSVSEIRGGGGG